MKLIPRFQNWIQMYYPGTKLSISEYSFASGTDPLVDMLTETDVLGIYGRQGLDFANMWSPPQPTDPLAYSFRIYRNFDGAGGQFGDTSVTSSSTDQSQLSVYGALRSSDGALTIVAINKTTSAIQTSLTLANFNPTGTAAVYTYSNTNLNQIVAGTPVAVASKAVSYTFPAYSVTVFVFTPATAPPTATLTSLSASSTQLTTGQTVKFTATVAPQSGNGTPTGTVTFSDGATSLGSATLTSGTATFSTSTLSNGPHTITAAYSGDANFSPSSSAVVAVAVSATPKINTSTSLSLSATQITLGNSVTFTANVAAAAGTLAPTGSITFLDSQTVVGSATLTSGSAQFSTATLSTGMHSISAAYSGDSNFNASSSAAAALTVATPPAT